MIRNLQRISNKNIDGMNKATENMKRGMFAEKDVKTKTFKPSSNVDTCYVLDRSLHVTDKLAMGLIVSDYDEELETIKKDEFGELEALFHGERNATDAFEGSDTDFEAGKYLKVTNGKLVPSTDATRFMSIGFIDDNGHKLLGFEVIK